LGKKYILCLAIGVKIKKIRTKGKREWKGELSGISIENHDYGGSIWVSTLVEKNRMTFF
jgi:hypothetical protein